MLDLRRPPTHPLVAASILAADFAEMADQCQAVLDQGADLLHLDVMDAHFVPNLTMGPDMCRALRRTFPNVYLDAHLMVEHPQQWIEPFAEAGANLVTFHIEVCRPMRETGPDPAELIQRAHHFQMQAGLAVNPPTEAGRIEPWIDELDLALIMSVHPGYAGQAFMPEVLEKTQWASQGASRHTRVEMDGGLKPANAPDAVAAGADVLVTASSLFNARDPSQVIRQMQRAGGGKRERG